MVDILICHLAGRFKVAVVFHIIVKAAMKTSFRHRTQHLSYQIYFSPISLAAGVNDEVSLTSVKTPPYSWAQSY